MILGCVVFIQIAQAPLRLFFWFSVFSGHSVGRFGRTLTPRDILNQYERICPAQLEGY